MSKEDGMRFFYDSKRGNFPNTYNSADYVKEAETIVYEQMVDTARSCNASFSERIAEIDMSAENIGARIYKAEEDIQRYSYIKNIVEYQGVKYDAEIDLLRWSFWLKSE